MTDITNTPELSESTEPAISYSTCYAFALFFRVDIQQVINYFKNKSKIL